MSIEVRPCGVRCNLRCSYCYQTAEREYAPPPTRPNMGKLMQAVAQIPHYWSLFGGEALLTPLHDLDELLSHGFTKHGRTGIQTNGTLINDAHIEMFLKYHTHVGISIDGPGELNDARWAGTLDATRLLTSRTEAAIDKLLELGKTHTFLGPSIICTLHKGNCAKDVFPRFVDWLRELDAKGLKHMNLHLLELDADAKSWALDSDGYGDRLIDLWKLQDSFTTLKFSFFDEIERLLQGNGENAVCVWHACDPWNTQAVEGYDSDGTRSGCSRMVKDGVHWLPAEGPHVYARQLGLYVSDQMLGGCAGCSRWLACQGQCPGTAESGDWRYRSSYCALYKRLFAFAEKRLVEKGIEPLPMWKDRKQIEQAMYAAWGRGENPTIESITAQVRKTACAPKPSQPGWHYDGPIVHGDVPHGDSHGDAGEKHE